MEPCHYVLFLQPNTNISENHSIARILYRVSKPFSLMLIFRISIVQENRKILFVDFKIKFFTVKKNRTVNYWYGRPQED